MEQIFPDPMTQRLDLGLLGRYANLLDSKFTLPGTHITFGIDPIVGLIPVVGAVVGYGFSALLILKTVQHGASKRLMLKMLINAGLDAVIGSIPLLGTIFDFTYKANERNLRLFKEHHEEGKHSKSLMPLFIILLLMCFGMIIALIWLMIKLLIWIF